MDEKESYDRNDRNEIFSKSVRAGKRTYFFDVKTTKSDEMFLTITESKRRFDNETGKFFFQKNKLFLYGEDFEKFTKGLSDVISFIHTGIKPEPEDDEQYYDSEDVKNFKSEFTDVDFDELTGDVSNT